MGLLDSLERGIEKAVRSAFSPHGGSLGPVEIATAVRRHMDRESTQAPNGATLVPNLYKIRLSETDFQEAKKYGSALAEELCQEIIRHADSQSYTLLGSVRATFVKNTELKRGQMSIETTTDAGAAPEAPAAPKAAAQPTPAAGPEATAALPTSMAAAGAQAATTTAILEHAGNTYPLGEDTIIGRSSSADITITDTGVSRQHLEIFEHEGRWYARDLGSTNGSSVEGQKLSPSTGDAELYDQATIAMGNARLRFRLG
ncbi:DUF3662 and FHA domain-containing protein [Nesterenkonia sp. NBAIMH1]|uniref:FhaA domain-containing protein n=1 Tax=Nesterenkonia sp. NBAIMH1 TaxID=2600320 RepID=UPI0011B7E1D5|nr:DUF3662 and FHA domain-containing protein [Nesterenkonia sp. NBAIMH1]